MILKYVGRIALLIFGLVILAVSLMRTSLNTVAQENSEDLKKNEVTFVRTDIYGNKETASYRLPEVGMLPNSIFYGFKRIRDYFWLISTREIEKPKVALLMADKKVMEYRLLTKADDNQLAIEAGIEALNKLKYANNLISNVKPQDDRTRALHQQILRAGLAYREIFRQSEGKFNIDEEYSKLISNTDDWNKEQEKARFEWDR